MRDQPSDSPTYASLLARAAAFLLDWAIVLLLATFISGVTANERARLVVGLVTLSLYHIGFLIVTSTTPGKMALRLHISDAAGQRLEPDRAILRFLVFLLSVLVVIGLPVSAVLVLLDPERRALHDRIANTRVRSGRPNYENQRP
jgi:uncharacterized RDD family membrane protein YckC